MDAIGAFTPEQARLLWQDYQKRQQLQPRIAHNFPVRRILDEPSPHRVFVLNTSSEIIPAYGCMQVIGTSEVGERTCVEVRKPTSTEGEFLLNSQFPIPVTSDVEPIETGVGWAYRFGVVRMLGEDPSPAGQQYIASPGSWEVVPGDGPFFVYGPDSLGERVQIGRIGDGGSSGGDVIEYVILSMSTETTGPYIGLKKASVKIKGGRGDLVAMTVNVIDHSGCIFDEPTMAGYTGWAFFAQFESLDPVDECALTPYHWAALNRCCAADSGTYASCT